MWNGHLARHRLMPLPQVYPLKLKHYILSIINYPIPRLNPKFKYELPIIKEEIQCLYLLRWNKLTKFLS